MPKPAEPEEVAIVRFFAQAPLEKAEVVYNLVCDSMRERLSQTSRENKTSNEKRTRRRSRATENRSPETGNAGSDTPMH